MNIYQDKTYSKEQMHNRLHTVVRKWTKDSEHTVKTTINSYTLMIVESDVSFWSLYRPLGV